MRETPEGTVGPVNINVGGTAYTVSPSTILSYPDTMLGTMLSERWNAEDNGDNKDNDGEESSMIFLDRDPVLFRYILSFYRNGNIVILCTVTKAEMFAEVEYFALPLGKEDIQYDMESIAEIRQGFHDFDSMIVDKLKKTARESAVVACANELAALLIEKYRKCPGAKSVFLNRAEVPNESFAKAMFYEVVRNRTFQLCFQDVVEQAGYSYAGSGLNSNSIGIVRVENAKK